MLIHLVVVWTFIHIAAAIFLLTCSSRCVIRHIVHVGNLAETFLTCNFRSSFTALGFFGFLTTFGIRFVQSITKTDSLKAGIILVSPKIERLGAKDVLVGIGGLRWSRRGCWCDRGCWRTTSVVERSKGVLVRITVQLCALKNRF
jgi:hypothetical protein